MTILSFFASLKYPIRFEKNVKEWCAQVFPRSTDRCSFICQLIIPWFKFYCNSLSYKLALIIRTAPVNWKLLRGPCYKYKTLKKTCMLISVCWRLETLWQFWLSVMYEKVPIVLVVPWCGRAHKTTWTKVWECDFKIDHM